ncbi:carboxymuconolactone decarboxylase family protein [Hymenobacter sp. H14-R3]|uniref:carboxymuconolactone decarboxylase family protein n=1 Tax=Hymenobacter sp. H14-R3 TaxID=3046308 RepID=UPI0024BB8E1E|nr:carboxymuconolactone decarboxylase family protein [Hymenobacter sp. H14-R3]MDJ0367707.1 carboxymuconolactone decarboxylase family protein [Hymenobacter sp. H14-R3]
MENTLSPAWPATRVVPKQRFDLPSLDPQAYTGLLTLRKHLGQSGLSLTHWDLINVHVSQLNGCAYCVMTHVAEALEHGETEQRLHALVAWREMPYFTAEERAILAYAEEVTLLPHRHVADAVHHEATRLLGEAYVVQVLLATVSMNTWNRLNIAQRKMPA